MKIVLILAPLLLLSACLTDKAKSDDAAQFKIVLDGATETKNISVYHSLGDKTFTRVQRYKVIALGENAQDLQILVAKVVGKTGNKVHFTSEAEFFPISNGSYTYECSHYYDVKISTPDESISDPTCSITPLGIMKITQPAVQVKG